MCTPSLIMLPVFTEAKQIEALLTEEVHIHIHIHVYIYIYLFEPADVVDSAVLGVKACLRHTYCLHEP